MLAFTEKTGEAVPGEINAGAYVLERSVLDLIPAGRQFSIEREVFPRLVGDGLCALRLDGYWMDIGTPERYLQATWDILEGQGGDGGAPDRAGTVRRRRLRGGATSARIGPRAVVSAGCAVEAEATVDGSVLLAGCTVGEGARVQRLDPRRGARRSRPAPKFIDAMVAENERVAAER